jgi:hypothetical protein
MKIGESYYGIVLENGEFYGDGECASMGYRTPEDAQEELEFFQTKSNFPPLKIVKFKIAESEDNSVAYARRKFLKNQLDHINQTIELLMQSRAPIEIELAEISLGLTKRFTDNKNGTSQAAERE